ncbi:1,2-oxophytodienoate reductase [Flavobacterium sp. Root901]|uniref:alkene reductase n=1 Tax=Flavobacterium sp. Root901 TaxID=1736605 RepID=UPI00070D05CF|nr:alkene reductase [Flavobacterium sp. Root901]KRD12094.1 1,2-oxophytodienoate reductase [Flavobacterium sp. Root901]
MNNKLFSEYQLGDLTLKNRIVMAPMTRGRAANPELMATDLMAAYYKQRASAGLIITEGCWVSPDAIGYINVPGIYTDNQTKAWSQVVDAVHDAGGKIFLQISHVGSVSHPDHLNGNLPLGPSAINPNEQTFTPEGFKDTLVPREMTVEDIKGIIEDFRIASLNAKKAGFDGVEIHGAHVYLFPQFLSSETNKRTDSYGGSVENRSRFVLELLEAVTGVWGKGRVGLKISPATSSGTLKPNADTEPTFRYLAQALNQFDLAYLHVLGLESVVGTPAEVFQDAASYFRPLYNGTLMIGGGLDSEKGEALLSSNNADLIAFGLPFIANPDLVERYRTGAALSLPKMDLLYTGGAEGYTDYGTFKEN